MVGVVPSVVGVVPSMVEVEFVEDVARGCQATHNVASEGMLRSGRGDEA